MISRAVLPLLASCYFIVDQILDLPASKEVVGVSSMLYFGVSLIRWLRAGDKTQIYDGEMIMTEGEDGKQTFTLSLNEDPSTLATRSHISFRVIR